MSLTDDKNTSIEIFKRYWRGIKAYFSDSKATRPMKLMNNQEKFHKMSYDNRKKTIQKQNLELKKQEDKPSLMA